MNSLALIALMYFCSNETECEKRVARCIEKFDYQSMNNDRLNKKLFNHCYSKELKVVKHSAEVSAPQRFYEREMLSLNSRKNNCYNATTEMKLYLGKMADYWDLKEEVAPIRDEFDKILTKYGVK